MARKRNSDTDLSVSGGTAAAPRRQTAARTRTKPAVNKTEPATVFTAPSREEIALLAYSLWEARGCQGGSPEEDWLRAEQQLSARAAAATA